MEGLAEWRQWVFAVGLAIQHRQWALVESLIRTAMLLLFVEMAASRGILILPV